MQKTRAFLKWAGGKYSLVDRLREKLPAGKRLVEPFVGACSVFLNTDYDEYLLNDINPDLINMYKILQNKPEQFIADAQRFFTPEFNDKERYYKIREKFNKTRDPYQRSLMFLYMNRHGFNGLCRYNKSGGFNVPFGSYKKPYFPLKELRFFAEKSKKATFICESYSEVYKRLRSDDVVYFLYRIYLVFTEWMSKCKGLTLFIIDALFTRIMIYILDCICNGSAKEQAYDLFSIKKAIYSLQFLASTTVVRDQHA
ncbi:Dam family site-specific DNA-(adenine-N6)-methyltransferase [Moritella sp.]|uniref:Dam family site-specific DNA-(adenine-N6)-methyltransferase n=1 Tax=Moritella sp. TaxID=78556 RepID=UPI0025D38EAF|nr:Dam family site-specific DNA-(adenine-N6)-methyltransferase [Moritella sp.]